MDDASETGPRSIRNVCIVAHINAGKTTLAERILFDAGRQRSCGDVDSGTTTMDSLRQEQERGISIAAGVSRLRWRGRTIQLVDTPGHVDFAVEVLRSLRAADGAVVVVDAVRGVESQTESVWRLLDDAELPRVVFVNKLDRATASEQGALESLRRSFPEELFVPMSSSLRQEGELTGLMDVIGGRSLRFDGALAERRHDQSETEVQDVEEALKSAYLDLVAAVAEVDTEVMAAFCEGREIRPGMLLARIRQAVLRRELVPVLVGSALLNRGVELLLEAVCALLPSPVEGHRHGLEPDPAGDFVGLAFQSGFDPSVRLEVGESLVRVFRGELVVGQEVECAGDSRRFVVESLFDPHGAERRPVERAGVGEIVAVPTPWLMRSGETIRAPGTEPEFEPLEVPEAVLSVRLEARSESGVEPLRRAAALLAAADPTLRFRVDASDGTVRLFGMGELHLEVVIERLRSLVSGDLREGRVRVESFETVCGSGAGAAAIERRFGGVVLRASARIAVEPASGAGRPILRWAVAGYGSEEQREFLSQGLREAVERAGGLGDPLRDLAVSLDELDFDVDQDGGSLLAVEAIGLALRRGLDVAGRQRLEPWADLSVRVPLPFLSSVVANLNARGAQVRDVVAGQELSEARACLPLRKLLGYATELRSATRGKGRFELAPAGLRPMATGPGSTVGEPKKTPGPP